MASETVERVLEAEKAARELVARAKAQGEQNELQAAKDAESALKVRLEEAQEQAEKIRAENLRAIDEVNSEADKKAEREKISLTESAEKKLSCAADAVIGALFG
jgi:hypothetical protein